MSLAVMFGSRSSRVWRFGSSRFEGVSFKKSFPGSFEREAPASADAEDARVSCSARYAIYGTCCEPLVE